MEATNMINGLRFQLSASEVRSFLKVKIEKAEKGLAILKKHIEGMLEERKGVKTVSKTEVQKAVAQALADHGLNDEAGIPDWEEEDQMIRMVEVNAEGTLSALRFQIEHVGDDNYLLGPEEIEFLRSMDDSHAEHLLGVLKNSQRNRLRHNGGKVLSGGSLHKKSFRGIDVQKAATFDPDF